MAGARAICLHNHHELQVGGRLGNASIVDEPGEKLDALRAFTEKILPGAWNDARNPTEQSIESHEASYALPLTEFPPRSRTGGVFSVNARMHPVFRQAPSTMDALPRANGRPVIH